jgi:hypothetical protein
MEWNGIEGIENFNDNNKLSELLFLSHSLEGRLSMHIYMGKGHG